MGQELCKRVSNSLFYAVTHHQDEIVRLRELLKEYLESPWYVSDQEIKDWVRTFGEKAGSSGDAILKALANPLFPKERLDVDIKEKIESLMDLVNGDYSLIKKRNEEFVEREIKVYESFFDTVE